VAVVLACLEQLKQGTPMAEAEEGDARLEALEELAAAKGNPEGSDEFDNEEYEEEELEAAGPETPSRSRRTRKKPASLHSYLEGHTREELAGLVEELATSHPEIRQLLEDRRTLSSGQTGRILRTVRQEIASLSQPEWDDHEYGHPTADLDRLRDHLQALLAAGQADAVARLGPELLEAGSRAVELEHEGESSYDLSACLELVFQALTSSLAPADQLRQAVEMVLRDEYSLCEAGFQKLWKTRFTKADWETLSTHLHQRLEAQETPSGVDDYSTRHRRDQISRWLIEALEKAGRWNEIIPLCEREAPLTFSYERLVDYLMAEKRWEEAEQWCLKGIAGMPSHYAGLCSSLRHRLQTVSEKSGNPLRSALANY
jgi:uncharacterized Zn finger protein